MRALLFSKIRVIIRLMVDFVRNKPWQELVVCRRSDYSKEAHRWTKAPDRSSPVAIHKFEPRLSLNQQKARLLNKGKQLLQLVPEKSTYSEALSDYDRSRLDPQFTRYANEIVDLIQATKSQSSSRSSIKSKTIQADLNKCNIFNIPAAQLIINEPEYKDLVLYGLEEVDANNKRIFTAAIFLKPNGNLHEILVETRDQNYYLKFEPSDA